MAEKKPGQAPKPAIKKDTQQEFLSNADLDRFLPVGNEEDEEGDSTNLIRQDQQFLAEVPRFTFDDLVRFLKGNIQDAKTALRYGAQAVAAGATVPVKVHPYIAQTKAPELAAGAGKQQGKTQER
ncbi:MAG: hypothetical protein K0R63_553 [Rickettsiales bacterium]|jgi:hypothetical protein|nr:hypothetical protein [Rickettsiales bacterium]